MYESFYGLHSPPFDLALNPHSLLLTPQHREALGNLEYGIRERVGVTVIIGEAGTGKTTLIRTAVASAEAEAPGSTEAWAYLRNPTLERHEFLEFLAARFHLPGDAATSKSRLIDELERMLYDGRRAALIVDEAQSVPVALLEEVRLLANIEADAQKLFPVVLVGQPELGERLNEPSLRQLKQRVALRCTLTPMSLKQTAAYIAGRIEHAGGHPGALFSREAVMVVYERLRGIPRTINVICQNALLTGYAEGQRPVGRDTVEAVCRDFDLMSAGILNTTSTALATSGSVPRSDQRPPSAGADEHAPARQPDGVTAEVCANAPAERVSS
jgi:type II secretory pathway predicted ATPase ExeA